MMRGRVSIIALLAAGLLAGALAHPAVAEEGAIRVRYRSADTVYLDAGRLAGLSVGDRLEVVREGRVLAVVEVVFVADHSASARPLEDPGGALGEIRTGDLARPLGTLAPPRPETTPEPPRREEASTAGQPAARRAPAPARRPTTRLFGAVTVDFERYADGGVDERDYDQRTARLSLRGRDLGGLPLELRIRMRARQLERSGDLGAGVPASEDRHRLYQLSLRWAPENGRFDLEAGRLGAGPFTGVGYLDGVSGRLRLLENWQVGAFFGSRPELTELGFESAGTKYGLFSRWTRPERGAWEVFVAGVREEDDVGRARDVAILETRLGAAGGRWSLLQRAEIDLGTASGSAPEGASDGRLTQLALALTGRLGERSRFVLSYDRYDPVLLFEDEFQGPADEIRDLLRQGLRASLRFGRPGGLDVSVSAGLREGEGDGESTYSVGLGLRRSRPAGAGYFADLLAFSNPYTEGALLTAGYRYGFGAGHSLGIDVGATAYERLGGDQRVSSWARLDAWLELPASLFARGELEVLAGDDAEGQRLRLGLGYRF